MRSSLFLVLVAVCAFVICAASAGYVKEHGINWCDLGRGKVTGSLGRPLGEIVTVEGVVVDDSYRREKADEGQTMLKISRVNGAALKKDVILFFTPSPFGGMKHPSPGAAFTYTGYETGGFAGIPVEAFKIIPQATSQDFHFQVRFQALKEG